MYPLAPLRYATAQEASLPLEKFGLLYQTFLRPLRCPKLVTGLLGNFIVYQDRIERNPLQIFAHAENSEICFIISVIIFKVSIVAEPKQAYLYRFFCFFMFPLPSIL